MHDSAQVLPAISYHISHSASNIHIVHPNLLKPNPLSLSIYGDPSDGIEDLKQSIHDHGILVPLVVTPTWENGNWEILSGHRRWACALTLELTEVPCEIRAIPIETARWSVVVEYNRQRRKSFSQLMREADVLEKLLTQEADHRRTSNLQKGRYGKSPKQARDCSSVGRNSDDRQDVAIEAQYVTRSGQGRTDMMVARQLGLGGKDLYRQARGIWKTAQGGDARAQSSVASLDAGTKTIHAAYKDLRRRDRFATDFQPTPYDVWAFRHDSAFGLPHPGSIPPTIIAHALHYYCPPGGLVVDPMAGGGTTVDVCQSMGRRCLAYDLQPTRNEIMRHDIRDGFPSEAAGCDLIFCDPPYHTMLADKYPLGSISSASLMEWVCFLEQLARDALVTVRPEGYFALLLAPQTEKGLPAGHGYLDHTFLGLLAILRAGFLPERRVSCPMSGGYLPQQVRRAQCDGRMLGQVRDLLVARKPLKPEDSMDGFRPFTAGDTACPEALLGLLGKRGPSGS